MDTAILHAILARMPSIAILLRDGQVSWVSRDEVFGWPTSVLQGGTPSVLWDPEDRDRVVMQVEQARPGPGSTSEVRVRTRQGDTRWVDLEVCCGPDAQTWLLLADITLSIQAEQRARQAEDELALLARCSNEFICRIDSRDRVSWSSGSTRRVLGWEAGELIGTVLADLIHPQDLQQVPVEVVGRLADPQAPHGAERPLRIRSKDGAYRWMRRSRSDSGGGESIETFTDVDSEVRSWQPDGERSSLLERALELMPFPPALLARGSSVDALVADFVSEGILRQLLSDTTGMDQVSRQLDGSDRCDRTSALFHGSASEAVAWLRAGWIQWVSESITLVLGWLPSEWVGRCLDDFVHRDDMDAFGSLTVDALSRHGQSGATVTSQFRLRDKDLRYHWVLGHARSIADGGVDGVAASLRVVDSHIAALDELDRQVRTDELTGLLSRREVLTRIAGLDRHARRTGDGVAILLCDVDRFKQVNDTYGHDVGDHVLKVLSDRIANCIRRGDMAARFGGDEILVILDGVHGLWDAVDIAEKIRIAAKMPMDLLVSQPRMSLCPDADDSLAVTLSIGVVLIDDAVDVVHAGDVIARADIAMYRAKQEGSDRVVSLIPRSEPASLAAVG